MPEGFFPFLWCLGLHLTLFAEIQVLEIGSLQRHDPVTVTLFRMPPFHACGHEGAAELLHPDARERARMTLAQQGDELGEGNGQGLFTRTGGTEVAGECFFRRASAVESHVGTLDFRLFFRREPVTFAAEEHALQLGIDLGMVDARAVDGMLHLHAEETAAARRVGEQFVAVGRGDEGGDARQAERVAPVSLAHMQGGELHHVLQGRMAADGDAVELVQVDEPHFHQELFHTGGVRHVRAVGVIGGKFGRQEVAAERGFSQSLPTAHQYRGHTVGMAVAHPHPLCGHGQHPPAEPAHPQRTVRHAPGQRVEAVFPVPRRQAVEIIAEGMVVGQTVGGHEARHVAVPAQDARLVGGEAEGVEVACREGEEGGRSCPLGRNSACPVSRLWRRS